MNSESIHVFLRYFRFYHIRTWQQTKNNNLRIYNNFRFDSTILQIELSLFSMVVKSTIVLTYFEQPTIYLIQVLMCLFFGEISLENVALSADDKIGIRYIKEFCWH